MIIKQIINFSLLALFLSLALNAQELQKCEGRRIISQSPYITHELEFFGMKECIVGASIYDEALPKNLPRTGKVFVPDKEAIAKLHPDFIFSSDWTKPSTMADITPLHAKSFILHGFASMQQVENNLYTIGNVLDIKDFETKVQKFKKEWRDTAHTINAKNKKVMLMSACSRDPYSYGQKTYLGDLFKEAGFDVIDKSKQVRVFKIGKDKNELDEFIKKTKPDFIFGFVPYTKHTTCSVLSSTISLPIIFLDGDLFLHPAPTLLEGLKELKSKESEY